MSCCQCLWQRVGQVQYEGVCVLSSWKDSWWLFVLMRDQRPRVLNMRCRRVACCGRISVVYAQERRRVRGYLAVFPQNA